jgi:hypothetical protein
MKMTAGTRQISKGLTNLQFNRTDVDEWFGSPGARRFHKRTTARTRRRLGRAIVRSAVLS